MTMTDQPDSEHTCRECERYYSLDDYCDDDGLCHDCAHEIASEIARVRRHSRMLANAIVPFALASKFYGSEWQDSDDLARGRVSPLSVGDLRRVVAALADLESNPDDR